MTQEVEGWDAELALAGINDNAVIGESLEKGTEVLEVLFRGFASNEDVVDVGVAKREASCNLVHEALKTLRSIPKSKRHTGVLKQAEGRCYGGFRNVGRLHGDLMVSFHEVDLGEHRGAIQVGSKVLDVRYWVAVGNCDTVEGSIITAGPPVARDRFGHHMER